MTLDAPHLARVDRKGVKDGEQIKREHPFYLAGLCCSISQVPPNPADPLPPALLSLLVYENKPRQGLMPRSFQTSWPSLPELPGKGQETLFSGLDSELGPPGPGTTTEQRLTCVGSGGWGSPG